ncbi:LOW QUALITY PROTEIN: disintegrin and metalloproteinase domain-containing protein 9-like [Menidia menidia]
MGGRVDLLEVCGLLLLLSGNCYCRDSQQTQHLSSYQLTTPRPIGGRLRRDADGRPPNQVSYLISVDGAQHLVHLERNQLLLPDDFTVFTYSRTGALITSRPPVQDHCHYRGFVQDLQGSAVAMSICSGLRGVLHLPQDSFGIEPLDSDPDQHLVYRLGDVTSQPRGCGTPHATEHAQYDPHATEHAQYGPQPNATEHAQYDPQPNATEHAQYGPQPNATEHAQYGPQDVPHRPHSRVRRAVLHKTHYVELLLVVDNERFNYMNRNATAVRDEMVQLASFVDSIYVQLNVRVVLVGLEIWTQQNPISTEGGAGEVLARFTQWREQQLVPRRRHDSAQLVLKKSFGGTAGMAFVSTVCSRTHGGGINAFTSNNLPSFASIVAHELGHNLGMNHDDGRSCSCPAPACIMHSGATGSRNFSSCSAEDLEKLVLSTGGGCLLNPPRPDEAYSAPYCGNGLLDAGEDCDCGSQEACVEDPCCEYGTCRLKAGAQCAYGECCYGCQLLPGGTVCRSGQDECDLPEFCNGSSPLCQPDVFVQDGQPCAQQQAYCYNGRCRNHHGQCRDIFGSKARAAPDICFKDVNSKGDRFGNCGYQNYGYKKCESRNSLCGKLQCSNVLGSSAFGVEPSIISTPIGGAKCFGVDFMLGSDVPDPGMVHEGTKCGEHKVCINFECRSADVLNYDCDPEKCHGHGVCNSNRNCHCAAGWAPPDCQLTGYGGSVDSGPTWNDKDTSLRDGLLVFFFLVIPLLTAAVLLFLRRDQLRRRLTRRRKRSQGYQADGAAPPNPSRAPPKAPPPAVARGNQRSAPSDGEAEDDDDDDDEGGGDEAPVKHQAQLLPPQEVVASSRPAPPPRHQAPAPPSEAQTLSCVSAAGASKTRPPRRPFSQSGASARRRTPQLRPLWTTTPTGTTPANRIRR